METQKLQEIIEQIKLFKQRGLSKLSDNTIMDVSVRIYNSEQIENHRQGQKPFDANSFSVPATPNQIWFLKNKLKYEGEIPKTSKEVSDLIDKLKGGSSKQNTKNFNKAYGK